MPFIQNPQNNVGSEELLAACKGILSYYSALVKQEAAVVSPNAGYKAYRKRVHLANIIHDNLDKYAVELAYHLGVISPTLIMDAQLNGIALYNYLLSDNPASRVALEMRAGDVANWNHVGNTSGDSIWDALANVNDEDML